jgi:hypothetical protein
LLHLASPLLHAPAGAYCTTIWHTWPAHFYIHWLVHIVPPFGISGQPTSTFTGWCILYHHLAHLASLLLHTPASTHCTSIWHIQLAHFYSLKFDEISLIWTSICYIWLAHFYMHQLVHIAPPFGTSGWPTSTCISWCILYHHLACPAGPLLMTMNGELSSFPSLVLILPNKSMVHTETEIKI